MILTQGYTLVCGVNDWNFATPKPDDEDENFEFTNKIYPNFEDNLVNYGRVVCQILDGALPCVLALLAILGLGGACSFSPAASWSMLTAAGVLTLSSCLLLSHNKLREYCKSREESKYYKQWEHFDLGIPSIPALSFYTTEYSPTESPLK